MTDSDDSLTDRIDADALRDAVPAERVRNALDRFDLPDADGGDRDLFDGDLDLPDTDLGDLDGSAVAARLRDLLDGRDTATGLLALGLGFDGLVYAVGRYLPEYLGLLGAGPVVIGLFGTLALALPVLYAGRWPDRAADVAPVAVPCLAVTGLVLWLVAPATPAPLPDWTLVVAGLGLVAVPLAVRDDAPVVPRPDALAVTAGDDDPRRVGTTVLAVGLVAALLVVTTGPEAALRLALALAAVGGATLATLRAVTPADDRPTDLPSTDRSLPVDADVRDVIGTVAGLEAPTRSLLVGAVLVDAAVGAISVFVVVVVTSVLAFQVSLLGVPLGPSAVFAALVAVELGAAGLARVASRPSVTALSPDRRLVLGGLFATTFPLLLVSVPPTPWLVAGLFAWYGLRTVGATARRELVEDALAATDLSPRRYDAARLLLVAPAATLGGLLYAVDPTLAFGAATAVGAVGLRELLRHATTPAT